MKRQPTGGLPLHAVVNPLVGICKVGKQTAASCVFDS
ncbi:MAG: hypothetical protein H6Q41_1304 [Deltaproteobacteria bacterium]|nr:hypothetical protein [Deltaproteobacteria bacterium]